MDITASIEQGAGRLDVSLPSGAAGRLAGYLELLHKWNRAQNLTAVTGLQAMVGRHVLDSLAGARWVGSRVLDVGTGAGLPGVPLAIADPSRRVVLLESRRKRIQFLLYVKQALALDNIEVAHARLEKYRADGKFDTLVTRAFAALPGLISGVMPFITAGARLVAWQGNDPSQGLEEALAGQPVSYCVHAVQVPGVEAPRHIVVIEPV